MNHTHPSRELCRYHAHYSHYHSHALGAFGHPGFAHAGGGIGHMIMMWVMHAIVSFAVWHILGSLFHHLGGVGSIIGGIVCIVAVYFIWRLLRRTVLA
jgi:hypothetical protein